MDTMLATRIALGTPGEGKYRGQYYLTKNNSKWLAHASLAYKCTNTDEVPRHAVIEIDGQTYADNKKVVMCDRCAHLADMDLSWMDRAACADSQDEDFFDPREYMNAVTKYCDGCPVALDCLDYAAANDAANVGSTWGGMYFRLDGTSRRAKIKSQRAKLIARQTGSGVVDVPCTINGCEKPVHAKTLCSMHYNRQWRKQK